MLEFIFEVLGEILLQSILELLAELGFESLRNSFRPAKSANPLFAAIGLMLLGGVAGLLTGMIFPHPLIKSHQFPGISLLLAPIGTGALMHSLGVWRRLRGGSPTCLATFWGGACFAFSMALVRWLMVAR